jgi:putative SOS response-associated peptidase YedK
MCFTVNVNLIREELESIYGRNLIDHEKYRPSYYYHAFSLPFLPVVSLERIELMQWGLIPPWVKDMTQAAEIRMKTFNARSESISEKPSFAESFVSRRCIVPVSGFFEWQQSGKNRMPWYITSSEVNHLSLGGIWNEWSDPLSAMIYHTFSIITTEANEMLSEIHNTARRMPLILDKDSIEAWLSTSTNSNDLRLLMSPLPSSRLSAHTISPLISGRRGDKDTPALIAPYDYQINGTLF